LGVVDNGHRPGFVNPGVRVWRIAWRWRSVPTRSSSEGVGAAYLNEAVMMI
jgi:hypothetical protein